MPGRAYVIHCRLKAALLIALLLILQSCSTVSRPFPVFSQPPLNSEEQNALQQKLSGDWSALNNYKLLYRAQVETPLEKFSLRYSVVADLQNKRYRIEVFPSSGFTALSLFVETPELSVFLSMLDRKYAEGQTARRVLEQELRVPLKLTDLIATLIGRVAQEIWRLPGLQVHNTTSQSTYLTLNDRQYWQLSKDGLLTEAAIYKNPQSDLAALVTALEFTEVEGFKLPQRMTLEIPEYHTSVQLELQLGKINSQISPSLFVVKVPAGYNALEY